VRVGLARSRRYRPLTKKGKTTQIIDHRPAGATAAGIPRSLAPCFQEYNLEQLDPARHTELIIERVLAYGDRRELRWLFDRYGREQTTNWVQRLGALRLPWRRYNLWCVLLELPPAQRLRTESFNHSILESFNHSIIQSLNL